MSQDCRLKPDLGAAERGESADLPKYDEPPREKCLPCATR
jgi:hypothetical protein